MAPIIRIQALRKDYHVGDVTVPALRGIDLEIQRGSFVAVIGASGSGKSSVLRAGLIPALQSDQPLADGDLPPAGSVRWLRSIADKGCQAVDRGAARS